MTFFKTGVFGGAACLLIAACASNEPAYPAYAGGGWAFNPRACPDLVEDYRDRQESRRDRRVNRGRLDRAEDRADYRESRRDERVTTCPASAWTWTGTGARPAYPARAAVYWDPVDRAYYRRGTNGNRVTVVVR
ncbi:MAG: hypothetical protein AAFR21_00465 [Pseudomonadota bacterium]